MARRGLWIAGGLLAAGATGIVVERLIVTDREAILMEAERAAAALSRGDVGETLTVLHPSVVGDSGDLAGTRRMLEDQLAKTPLDKVNFLVRELKVENGAGVMSLDVMVLPRDPKQAGANVVRVGLLLEWRKDGKDWKVVKYSLR